jgi:hypothetical protein
MQLIPMMMIIGIDLYKSGIGLFFVINTVISWSSIMAIINGHLVDNYSSKGPFLIIMRQNDENLGNFYFLIFFDEGGSISKSRSTDDVDGFSFLLQCSLVASLTHFELA